MDFLNLEFSKLGTKKQLSIRTEGITKIRRDSKKIIIDGSDWSSNFTLKSNEDAEKNFIKILDSLKKADHNFIKFYVDDFS
ncbi:MAG TPA: hypothetical protein VK186_05310 [Candidatus Deferrimicrobium sp.]|nr:hypothetical protein [Candidatus Deferrimicrobium sp.]